MLGLPAKFIAIFKIYKLINVILTQFIKGNIFILKHNLKNIDRFSLKKYSVVLINIVRI
jgi:hypothetical protein